MTFAIGSGQRLTFDVVEDVAGDVVLLRQQVEHVRGVNVALLLQSRLALLLIVFQLRHLGVVLVEADGTLEKGGKRVSEED